jgi:hypothetical protein
MAGVNRFEALIRAILWLGKRGWGLSFLLAFVSFCVIVAIPGEKSNALFEGPVFWLGIQMGAIFFPDYTTRGTNGFYLVPLFGAGANFLVLMALWFVVVRVVQYLRAEKQNIQQS